MDQAEFERLLANVKPATAPVTEGGPQLDTEALASMAEQAGLTPPKPDATQLDAQGLRPDGTSYSQPPAQEPALADPSSTDAVAGGALKGVFETKDFLFGDTLPDDRSEFRKSVEDTVDLRRQQSIVDGFSAGIGQFAVGMIGLGKARWIAKGLPWVGRGLGAIEATRKGRVALESAKAATVGAVAFDPHEERLSNLIQGTPLANPLNAWLAADPSDSAAEGRVKAALESIGLDAAILGTFMAGTKIWKALRKGDTAAAERLAAEFETSVAKETEAERSAEQGAVAPPANPDSAGSTSTTPTAEAPQATPLSQAGAVDVQVVSNPTEAAQAAGVETPLPSAKPRIKFSDEDTAAVLSGMEADADAMTKHGGWYQAVEAGHTFGKGDGIPYVKLNSDADVDDFMARVVDAAEERLDSMKGGDVLSDERVTKLVDQRVALFDDDPALLLGQIQKAGKDASHMVAEMEAGYLLSARMFQDTYALANRIRMGDFAEFGGKEAAVDELKKRLSLAASVYGSARSITSNAARSVRRMRGDFKLKPEDVAKLKELDGDQLAELLVSTQGSPRNIAKLANPSMWTKAVDFGQFLLINNLVSGPKTQLINMLTNSYMVGARPLERILGSVIGAAKGDAPSRAILQESVKQYAYMGTSLGEAFTLARKAFMLNDSVLSPHRSEMWRGMQTGAPNAVPVRSWKPWDSVPNVLHNALQIATNTVGMPTRALGTVDELVKQTVYRSTVMARAHMEAVKQGAESGLEGDGLKSFVQSFVRDKLDKAFDAEGRGVDAGALREANIATFQQELLAGTWGRTVHQAVGNHPELRLVLPFVKTPANVLRYGWKLTPGLNAFQKEFRDMWLGRMGREQQAQAYGQMATGTLFMGYAAYLVSNGTITGAGPSDYKAQAELKATGWQPYSIVFENADGSKTYVPYGRYDPIAIPFGIIADIQDAIHNMGEGGEEDAGVASAIGGLSLALAKQFTSKTYLSGLGDALDAIMEPDRHMSRWAGQTVANFIPFSAALRQVNPDPYLREARDVTDKVMATIPGLSEKVPARYDWAGDPMLTRKGLWTSDEDSVVDREVQRLALEGGSTIVRPQPVHDGVDLRDVTMADGKNAYEAYQQLSGRPSPKVLPLKRVVARRVQSESYKRAPDGDAATKGTKLWILHDVTSRYRSIALKRLKRDPVVREAFLRETMRVRAAYAAARPIQPERPSIGKIGDSFGVDLKALLGPAPQAAAKPFSARSNSGANLDPGMGPVAKPESSGKKMQ
ncbi:hypothetical protein [Pseudaminobacter soli (ex Li et al. 2025)]|uniref:Uncharacterized protein n=1 Tax=Pseudaminobacter soli (ex Li et al. 2025) TaxID=1295366 RepID=A0A2P7S9R1_9HYPH|nr:hypothetical protein [Mesorhizobium soli]PSJ59238.1 hypothetical protein C7I85_16585 [Mesorhizobium soli]